MAVTIKGATTLKGSTVVGFSPASLFSGGEQGVWYDPSDFSTMFQNSNGTGAVAVGDPVGKILDKSGRGNHAIQTTAGSRPTLQKDANGCYYLSFNGSSAYLTTYPSTVDFSSISKASIFYGSRKLSDAGDATIVELGANTAGGINILAPGGEQGGSAPFQNYTAYVKQASVGGTQAKTYAQPITNVVSVAIDTALTPATSEIVIRVNGAAPGSLTSSGYGNSNGSGSGNFANSHLWIGARAGNSTYFTGNLYSLIIRGAASTAGQISATETWVNARTKAY